jgi:hypothetical protein
VLRRIFGPKRDEVMRDWRKLHKELCNMYSSSNIIRMIKSRRMKWAGQPEGKRSLGRTRCRWVDNTKTDLQEIGWDGMGWYGLDRTGSG